jgi:hypothetical protein
LRETNETKREKFVSEERKATTREREKIAKNNCPGRKKCSTVKKKRLIRERRAELCITQIFAHHHHQ